MNILIPMAGRGSRFDGYTFPKPLIDVEGRPMVQAVVESLGLDGRYIFLARAEHIATYALEDLFDRIAPYHVIVPVQGTTDGAACTALLARGFIDTDEPLVIANSDQVVVWDQSLHAMLDGLILTFTATHPKWSFVRTRNGLVTEVAEKRPISTEATCGIYAWAKGSDFVRSAESMIQADKRVNGEFYIAPTFNELVAEGAKIATQRVRAMWGLGTPEDLQAYLDR